MSSIIFQWTSKWGYSTGSGGVFVPNRWKSIIWNNYRYASLGLELMIMPVGIS